MEHLPLDARSVVDELRSAPRPLSGALPRTWVPSQSFGALLEDADVRPVSLERPPRLAARELEPRAGSRAAGGRWR